MPTLKTDGQNYGVLLPGLRNENNAANKVSAGSMAESEVFRFVSETPMAL